MPRPPESLLALLAAQAGRPFTTAEALAAGVSESTLRTAVRRGRIRRLRRGVYCAHPADQRARIVAAARKWPTAVVSHESAAHLLGLPTWRLTEQVVLTHPSFGQAAPALRIVERALPPSHVVEVGGTRCTTAHRTAMDLAATLPLPQALITADAAGRRPGATRAQLTRKETRQSLRDGLARVVEQLRGCAGARTARLAARLADPAAESPPESMARGLIYSWGFPQPLVGHPVLGFNGTVYYADLLWPAHQLIGEVDGALKYDRRPNLWTEKIREDEIRAQGLDFARLPAPDVLAALPKLARLLAHKGLPHGSAQRATWR